MDRVQALLFCALLIPAVASGQESDAQSQAGNSSQQTSQGTTDEGQDSASGKTTSGASMGKEFMDEQDKDQVRSDQLMGSPIVNESGEEIGTIDNLLLNEQGQVAGIIVGVGGFLGIGEKHVALAWEAVEISSGEGGGYEVTTRVDKTALEEATAFKTEESKQPPPTQEQQQKEKQEKQKSEQQ